MFWPADFDTARRQAEANAARPEPAKPEPAPRYVGDDHGDASDDAPQYGHVDRSVVCRALSDHPFTLDGRCIDCGKEL